MTVSTPSVHTPDVLIAIGTDNRVFFWNHAAEEVYGVTVKDAIGKYLHELFQCRWLTIKQQTEAEVCLSKTGMWQGEYFHIKKNGEEILVRESASKITGNKENIGVLKVINESTRHANVRENSHTIKRVETVADQLTRLEKELSRLAGLNLIGEMAASIGHEVRNPLTIIRGFLQMFKDKKDNFDYGFYVDIMIQEIDRANMIITEFLSLSHHSGELVLRNINDVVRALAPLIQADAQWGEKNICIDLGDIPEVALDENEIRQCILNLVRNGIEAIDKGGTVTIKTFVQKGKVVLAVIDDGPGISPEIYAKLSTPFTTSKPHGTGLGLTTCYRIAKRHHAEIAVDTGTKGTAFTVSFQKGTFA
ncbi:MAG: multi-sensor signal transduction histidine kinase [Firmicutes bacterium]|nr:multi-sensor signal transduction histidine kinase [Bacillota bacterium]